MSKYHDDTTQASDPVDIILDPSTLVRFKKELTILERLRSGLFRSNALLDEHLGCGDSRAAVVVSIAPSLIVAAYTDEMDCVSLLEFPLEFVGLYGLSVGSRLLTVNTYCWGSGLASDLVAGPGTFNRYPNFFPMIAEFFSCDIPEIEKRKAAIDEDEWGRARAQGIDALENRRVTPRDGSPYRSSRPRRR
ncbi:MAG: hypothetical protein QGG25_13850 [Phycisphaerae bacterium]|jgi:hypothetical protein|nr:hypothetical protein [Phycisphaerae bacterium]